MGPVLEASGSVAVSGAELTNSYGLQLQSNSDLAHLGFPQQGQLEQAPHEKKKTSKKKAAAVAQQQISAGIQATAGLQGGMQDTIYRAMVTLRAMLPLSNQGSLWWTWTQRLTPTMTRPSPWRVQGDTRSLSRCSSPEGRTSSTGIRRGSPHSSLQPPQDMIRWWKYCLTTGLI